MLSRNPAVADDIQPSFANELRTELVARLTPDLGDQYALDREIGHGGAAIVFLAHDRRHDRPVAIKVLRPEVAVTVGSDRFLREIRLAARLAHPHILPVLDSGVAGRLQYYVMPFVQGESLRSRLERDGPIPLPDALRLAGEVGDALEYAHAAGIIHRDVKPENVLLLGGHAVLADFGIARAIGEGVDERVTAVGIGMGTPAYMSPEQAMGDHAVDGRTDQYALAAMLFEMIAGQPPFFGGSFQQTLVRKFTGPPPSVREAAGTPIPDHVDNALSRALATDPDNRFDDVRSFVAALQNRAPRVSGEGQARAVSGADTPALPPAARVPMVPLVPDALRTTDVRPSVAVLPFENRSQDPEMDFLSEGVTDEIISLLSRLRAIRVAARGSSYAVSRTTHDARVVGEHLRVGAVLEGSVQRSRNRVRIRAHLADARTAEQRWSAQFDRELDDLFAIQDDIARGIVETLHVELLGVGLAPIGVEPARSSAVHDVYLRGRHAANKRTESGLRSSIDLFHEAVAADPEYVAAYAALAESLLLLAIYGVEPPGEVMPLAARAAGEALERDPTRADALVTLGSVEALFDWNLERSSSTFRRALVLSPENVTAHQRFALDCLVPGGAFEEAAQAADRACRLDPLSPVLRLSAALVRYFAGNRDDALARLRAVVGTDPEFAMAQYFLGTVLRDDGRSSEAVTAFDRALTLTDGGSPEMVAGLAQAHARAGNGAEAERLLARLTSDAARRFVAPSLFAQVELSLGRAAEAMRWLERARDAHDPELAYLRVRPVYRTLDGHDAFEAVCQTVGLPRAS